MIWAQKKRISTRETDLNQVEIQKLESNLVQNWGLNQKINVHTLSPLTECDRKILVILFHGVLVQDSILTLKY